MDLIDIAIAKSLAEGSKGQPGGTASLDDHGKVPAEQLPSYVDDIVEGYFYEGKFYEDEEHTKEITPSKAVIYYDVESGKDYRWTGSDYIEVPSGEITAEYISSAGATLGQVLTADGSGGADWLPPTSITVDSAMSGTSENPVQNKVIADYLSPVFGTIPDPSLTTYNYTFATNPPFNSFDPTTEIRARGFIVGTRYDANAPYYIEAIATVPNVNDYELGLGVYTMPSVSGYYFGAILKNNSAQSSNTCKLRFYTYNSSGTLTGSYNLNAYTLDIGANGYYHRGDLGVTGFSSSGEYFKSDKFLLVEGFIPVGRYTQFGGNYDYIKTNNINVTINSEPMPSPFAVLESRVSELENNPPTIPIASSSTLGGIKVGNRLSIDSSTGELSADAQNTQLENRFNEVFGDIEPPETPQYPPVKTNYVLPSSVLPMRTGYDFVTSIFYVNGSGSPIYEEVYCNLPTGVTITGYGMFGTSLVLTLLNTNSSSQSIPFYSDRYNGADGTVIQSGISHGNCGASANNWNGGRSISYDRFNHEGGFKITLQGTGNVYAQMPTLLQGDTTVSYSTGSSGLNSVTITNTNTDWLYTINAGDPTVLTPWEQINYDVEHITAGDVDSESATSGYVLTADGAGGASWQAGGSGVTVDSAMSGTSENPVQNKVITNEILSVKQYFDVEPIQGVPDYKCLDTNNQPILPPIKSADNPNCDCAVLYTVKSGTYYRAEVYIPKHTDCTYMVTLQEGTSLCIVADNQGADFDIGGSAIKWYVFNQNGTQLATGTGSQYQSFTVYNSSTHSNHIYCVAQLFSGNIQNYISNDMNVVNMDAYTGSEYYYKLTGGASGSNQTSAPTPFMYTLNAGTTGGSPWDILQNKVSSLQSRENIRTYFDSSTHDLYITNDGSDPTPSNS